MELLIDVTPPPCQALIIPPLTPTEKDQVSVALKVLKEFERDWPAQAQSTQVELTLVDEFMYKSQNRFRNDQGHRDVKRVLLCIRRALALRIDQLCRDWTQVMPLGVDVRRNKPRLYGPSREMLEFLLLRLWGFRALIEKAQTWAGLCGHKQLARIRLGHFWNVALQKLSSVARLWSNMTTLLPQVAEVYRALYALRTVLPSSKVAFLPPGTELPDWPTSSSDVAPAHLTVTENVVPSDPDQSIPSEIGVIERELDLTPDTPAPIRASPLGMTRAKWKHLGKMFKNWTQPADLAQFLMDETRQRKTDRHSCVTKALNQTQWKQVKTDLMNFMAGPKTNTPKAVSLVKQRLRFWLVRPDLAGQKPPDWHKLVQQLESEAISIKNAKKMVNKKDKIC
ncbi:uncharacterized protein LOC131892707 isoform X2 [Tigriopus californicus]|uniref:uncharacterized protein LOC131892707 isoform X2 n=1 Tax=Tigriopus californicus TaxID=6832 RepID=UPI0027DAA00A|nr:uncharacterized protein LOC131892707 isoform X2 [Tigriopus californicus]